MFVAFWATLFALPALARDLDGRYAQSPHKDWVESLKDRKGVSCCHTADGYDVQWDTQNEKYRVYINEQWYEVPTSAVLDDVPNRLGVARVWYSMDYDKDGKMTPHIRCFLPGSGT